MNDQAANQHALDLAKACRTGQITPKPRPTTGEWTSKTVDGYWTEDGTRTSFYKTVADAHNAAIAAEKEKYREECEFSDSLRTENAKLRDLLAAEREAYALALQMKNIETTRANEAEMDLRFLSSRIPGLTSILRKR